MPQTRQAESEDYLTSQILTYLGNKRALLRFIGEGVENVKDALGKTHLSFFDAFSGSGIVSRFMKRHASLIIANDLERYSEVVNRCYLTNRPSVDWEDFDSVFREWRDETLSHLAPGTISRLYAPQDDNDIQRGERVFYTRENAVLLDSARAAIDRVVPEKFFALVLAPLLAEASVHANTAGVFKGFYKNRRGIGEFGGEGRNARSRICAKIELQKPVLSNFSCESVVLRGDANEVAKSIEPVDLAYFDPPYNQHPYGSNYFMLNLLVENKMPERISKVAGIAEGWNRSNYNKRQEAAKSFFALLEATPAKFLLVSYNSEGFIPKESLLQFLETLGNVEPLEIEYNTFRGSRNLRGRPLKVTEYLFLVRRK
ncbi:MAG: DNA adenine methylase [Kiritimatiellae bacterium]|nr:DNA adenine methylase [Kiritimatiellia bacterium]